MVFMEMGRNNSTHREIETIFPNVKESDELFHWQKYFFLVFPTSLGFHEGCSISKNWDKLDRQCSFIIFFFSLQFGKYFSNYFLSLSCLFSFLYDFKNILFHLFFSFFLSFFFSLVLFFLLFIMVIISFVFFVILEPFSSCSCVPPGLVFTFLLKPPVVFYVSLLHVCISFDEGMF